MGIEVKVLASGSDGNCYRVSDGNSAILLDAGIPIKRIREGCNFDLASVEGAFITHSHGDHCKAVKDLVRFGCYCYMTEKERAVYIEHSMNGCESYESWLKTLARDDKGEGYQTVKVGSFLVLPFSVQHDTPEPVGFLIYSEVAQEKLLYFTDTYYLKRRFGAFDYLIGEVNYDDDSLWEHINGKQTGNARAKRLFTSHMSLDTFLEFLRANDLSKLKKIWICHMSNDHGNEAKIKEAVQRETGAEVEVC